MIAGQMIAAGAKRRLNRFQRGQDLRGQLAHAASAEGEDEVALADFGGDQLDGGRKLRGKVHLRPLDAAGQPLRRHAGDGLLAGGVDGQDDDGVCISKCATELVEEVQGARVPVGLEDDVDAPVAAFAGSGQGGANLSRMVAVVVHHGDAAHLAALLEAPVHAAKVMEPLGDLVCGNLELVGNGHRGGGVEHVVATGYVQLKGTERAGGGSDQEAREGSLHCLKKLQAVVGLCRDTIGEDAPVSAGQDGLELRIVQTGGNRAVKRHLVHERQEGALDVGHVVVAVHVLAVEIGDHGGMGESLRKERSLSSASATRYCVAPRGAFEPSASTRPPTTTVASRPPAESTEATMEVVVVLPCMPAVAMPYLRRISSASISPRWMTGIFR